MKPYTVVLLRPDYMAEEYGTYIYIANAITAEDPCQAVEMAQREVYLADMIDEMEPQDEKDYALCVLFEGHHEPKLFGWQAH